MKKNDRFTGTCTDYTYNGLGVVKNDTFCVFVKDMALGDTGEIVITAMRKTFAYGRLVKLEKAGEGRTEGKCPIHRQCGGCQLQHLTCEGQAYFKYHQVTNALETVGGIHCDVRPVITMEDPYRYRNKVILPVGEINGETVMGFYRYNSHDIIPMKDCLLQSRQANELAERILTLITRYNLQKQIRNVMIRDFVRTGQMMVVLVTRSRNCDLSEFTEDLVRNDSRIKSVIQNINGKDTNVVLGNEEILLYGSRYVQDELCGLTFEISSRSFYQINTVQTEKLYQLAVDLAGIRENDTVLDLYCGVGTIGLIASRKAGKVIGVEIVEEAIMDARKNAEINGIDNVEFFCGDAGAIAQNLADNQQHPDVIFVDPPRKGCSRQTLDSIVRMAPDRLVYVSCDPATLARDLAILQKEGYEIKVIQPLDQFPQTYHVETVVLMTRMKLENVMNGGSL